MEVTMNIFIDAIMDFLVLKIIIISHKCQENHLLLDKTCIYVDVDVDVDG